MPNSGLKAQHIYKSYGRHAVVSDVSFEVAAGRLLRVSGHNGAGKSTLLRIMATLCRPDSGHIEWDGRTITTSSVADFRKLVTFSDTNLLLDPQLTVGDHRMIFANLFSIDRSRETKLFELLDLDRWSHVICYQLSQGFQKRLELALQLMRRAHIRLFDEPFVHLDESASNHVREALAEACAQGDICVVVSHENHHFTSLEHTSLTLEYGKRVDCE